MLTVEDIKKLTQLFATKQDGEVKKMKEEMIFIGSRFERGDK